jgi:hypothetical protein
MESYDRTIAHDCAGLGCAPGAIDDRLQSRAMVENRLAIGIIAAGAAVVAVGSGLLYMNRPRAVYHETIETILPGVARIDIAPIRGGGTLVLRGEF